MTRPLSPDNDPRAGAQTETPPPDKVNQFHRYDDVDSSPEAHHHTLGSDITQASPGTHNHDGRDSKILSEYSVGTHTHDALNVSVVPVGNIASVNVQDALSELDGEKSPTGHTHGFFIQDTAPSVGAGIKYLWVQTNMAPSGEGITFWVEDGD